ncbi:MAG: hypothetical protein DRJ97_02145 [Thermoprotei archaeon]|nr:MAG: hypothetical protein DRJ97_02145 [Thermoprotei archaeon]
MQIELLVVFVLASLPISEVRGAIPYGVLAGLDPLTVFLVAVAGNIVPVPLLLMALSAFEALLLRLSERTSTGLVSKIVKAYFKYAFRARDRVKPFVNRYGAIGLALFTAIPLPFTGAWTSALAAHVLGMDRRVALASISAGVVIAALLVSAFMGLLTLGVHG